MVILEHYPRKSAEANNVMYKTYHLSEFPTLCTRFHSESMYREKGQKNFKQFSRISNIG